MKKQILLDASRNLTIKEFINKYAPSFENNTEEYLKYLLKESSTTSKQFNENTKLYEIINTIGIDNFAKLIFKKEDISFYKEVFE